MSTKASTSTRASRFASQVRLKPDVIVFLFSGITLGFCTLLSAFWLASLVSVAVSIIYVLAIVKERPAFIFKYLIWFVTFLLVVGGVLSVEFTDIYLPRLSASAHFAGSIPLLMLAYWFFFVILLIYDSRFGVEKSYSDVTVFTDTNLQIMRYLTYLMFIAILFCFYFVLYNPSFVSGLNRFEYMETQIPSIARYVSRVLEFMVIIPILYFKQTKSKTAIATVALYCVYLFWINTKFGLFLAIFTIIVLVYYDKIMFLKKRRLHKLIIGAGLLILGLVCVATISYSFTSDISTSYYLAERLAGEGERWWRTYDLLGGDFRSADFGNEINALFLGKTGISENVGSNNGIYGIMYFVSPASTVNSVLSQGWRFTESGFAAAYYYFGPLGTIGFGILSGVLVAFVQNSLLRAIYYAEPIKATVLVYFTNLVKTAIAMFIFVDFLRPLSIVFYLYLILDKLLSRQRPKRIAYKMSFYKARLRD